MAEKKSYNACKETGDIGKREEIVLNKKWCDLISKLDVSKMIDPLKSTGILNPMEYREILSATENAARLMMSYVAESGPDGFIKFMDALRMAGYKDLAADLEMELKNTEEIPDTYHEGKKNNSEKSSSSLGFWQCVGYAVNGLQVGSDIWNLVSVSRNALESIQGFQNSTPSLQLKNTDTSDLDNLIAGNYKLGGIRSYYVKYHDVFGG